MLDPFWWTRNGHGVQVLHGKYKAARAAQNRQLLNFQARVMNLCAQETLFGGLEKWQRMQLQYSYGDMHEIIVRAVDDT